MTEHTADYDARMKAHVVTVTKIHKGRWDNGIFKFLASYRAAFQPPYPSTIALLSAPDEGHARAYARAIEKHAVKYDLGYTVRVDPMVETEATCPIPPEETGDDA